MLLDRLRRPCFWVLGDNRCGPSISGEKEMARGTSRDDLEVLDASVNARAKERKSSSWMVEGGRREKERGDMKVAHTAQKSRTGVGRIGFRGSRGWLVFCLPGDLILLN
jgi:hypothetical protein